MKLRTFTPCVFAMGLLVTQMFAQNDPDVKDVGAGRRATYTQIDATSAPTLVGYDFNVAVGTQSGGTINTVTVTGPASSVIYNGGNGVSLTGYGNGFEYQSGNYTTLAAFSTAFPTAGSYKLNLDTSGGSNPDYVVEYLWPDTATYTTATYPSSIPIITSTGGYWSNGSLYLDVTQNQTFTWNFADYGAGNSPGSTDGSTLEIEHSQMGNVFDFSSIGSASSGTTINANTLVVGQTYDAALAFGRIVDNGVNNPNSSPMSGIVGADSTAYYLNKTQFTIVAIPEPSTYALMGLGLGLVALPWLRRRFSR